MATTTLAAPLASDTKKCSPFSLKVMVMMPKAGFKIQVTVQRSCTDTLDEIWKVIFILQKKIDGKFEDIVSVEFEATKKDEKDAIASIAENGMTKKQSDKFAKDVFNATKVLEDGHAPTQGEKTAIHNAVHTAVTV